MILSTNYNHRIKQNLVPGGISEIIHHILWFYRRKHQASEMENDLTKDTQ